MKNKSTFVFFAFSLLFYFSVSFKVCAQEFDIYELIEENQLSEQITNNKGNNRADFYNLSQNLHPTIYISNNSIKKEYGNRPFKKITFEDAISYSLLKSKNKNYLDVELITFNLKFKSDIYGTLDLTNIAEFNKLKYVFIKCYFKYGDNEIRKFIKVNSNVRVFHISANPS